MNAMESVRVLIALVRANEDTAVYGGRCSPESIAMAEEAMGLAFPPSYRKFIEEYGTCDFGSQSFLGMYVIDGELWGSHGATLEAREAGMPHHLIEVAHDGMGGTIALDASQPDADGEYPVVVWEAPDQPVLELLAPSFGAYALDVFQQVAERKNG